MAVTRQQMADALSSVAGVDGLPYRPAVVTPGLGWPEWQASSWLNGCATAHRWYVYVALPGDPRTSIEAGDALLEAVGNALSDLTLTVDQVEPWRVPLGPDAPSSAPALRYSCID